MTVAGQTLCFDVAFLVEGVMDKMCRKTQPLAIFDTAADGNGKNSTTFCEGRQLFYIHIQKTGGRSVTNLISSRFQLSAVLQQVHVPGKQRLNFDSFQYLTGHVSYGFIRRFARRPVVLTFMREPLERALSAYYFFRHDTQETLDKIRADYAPKWAEQRIRFTVRARDLSLLDFLQQEPELAQTRLANLQTRALLNTPDPWDAPPMPDAAMLQEATCNLRACDIVGLTERMDDSLSLIAHYLRWEGLGPMPHHNANLHRKKLDETDPQAVEILKQWNQLDVKLYRIAQELMDERLAKMRGTPKRTLPVHQLPHAAAFTFDQAIHGHGWEPRETLGGEWFAWIGAEPEAWIDLQVSSSGAHHLQCRIAHLIRPSVLDGLQVAVNGRPLEIRLHHDTSSILLDADVPAAVVRIGAGKVRISFLANETARPCDINSALGDKRSLAIAVSAISMQPSE